jgi:hypothetical protein
MVVIKDAGTMWNDPLSGHETVTFEFCDVFADTVEIAIDQFLGANFSPHSLQLSRLLEADEIFVPLNPHELQRENGSPP